MSIELAKHITGYYDENRYAWIIDTDHLYEPGSGYDLESGTMGPSNIREDLAKRLEDPDKGLKFRMYDDDGELYYSGRIVLAEQTTNSELLFRPLTDFGEPNAGATEIRYWDDDTETWETL